MRSSISSSSDRIPQAPWSKVWLIAIMAFFLLLGGWEFFWRLQGFKPSLNDDAALWALSRKKATQGDENTVVFIGASRIQLDINTDVFAELTGKRPNVLAIDGQLPIPVLRDLADDSSFRGTIICELPDYSPFALAQNDEQSEDIAQAVQWVRQYKERTFSADLERNLKNFAENTFVFRLPDLSLRNVFGNLRLGRLPMPTYLLTKQDRSRLADYTKLDIKEYRRKREELTRIGYDRTNFTLPAFLIGIQKLEELVAKIQERGGKVIFVRFPTSGSCWQMDEAYLPKAKYWDVFASRTRARTIHFKDYSTLSAFDCPDCSHLDYRDAIPFTKALVDVLNSEPGIQP